MSQLNTHTQDKKHYKYLSDTNNAQYQTVISR